MTERFATGARRLWAGGKATADALGKGMGEVHVPSTKTSVRLGAAAALAAAMLRGWSQGSGPLSLRRSPARRAARAAPGRRRRCRGRRVLPVGARERGRGARGGGAGPGADRREPERRRSPGAGLSAGVRPMMLAVGPTTAAAARASGWAPAAVSSRPDAAALATACAVFFSLDSVPERDERPLLARLPAGAGRAAARLDDAPGRPLSPPVSRRPRSAPISSRWCGRRSWRSRSRSSRWTSSAWMPRSSSATSWSCRRRWA